MSYAPPPPGYGPGGPPHHHHHHHHAAPHSQPGDHGHDHSHSYSQPPPPPYPHGNSPNHSPHHGYGHGNPPPPHPSSRHVSGHGGPSMPPVHPQVMTMKRGLGPHVSESPAKKQSKWSAEEDALIIELRGGGMKWEDISKRLPGRSAISCRLHYQNYLERRSEWDEERKNKLARLYERFKPEMWQKVAEEMAVPWRAAEAMHWRMGEEEMAKRAGVVPFSLSVNDSSSHRTTLSRGHSQPPPPRQDYPAPPHAQQHSGHHPYAPPHHHTISHPHAHSHSMSMGHPGHGPPPPQPPPPHHMHSPHGSHSAHMSGPPPPRGGPSHMNGPMSHPRSGPPPLPMSRHEGIPGSLPPPMAHDLIRDRERDMPPSHTRPPGNPGHSPRMGLVPPQGPPQGSGPQTSSDLAPLHTQTHGSGPGRSGGALPSLAELTNGVVPYPSSSYPLMTSGPPNSGTMSHANTTNNSPVAKNENSPCNKPLPPISGYPPTPTPNGPGSTRGGDTSTSAGPSGSGNQGGNSGGYEGAGAKRPASPSMLSRDGSRRRYYERPEAPGRRRMM